MFLLSCDSSGFCASSGVGLSDSGSECFGCEEIVEKIKTLWLGAGEAKVETKALVVEDIQSTHDIEHKLKESAITGFYRFFGIFGQVGDFWMVANTCDACLSLVSALLERWPKDAQVVQIKQDMIEILAKNYGVFNSTDRQKEWADDSGWWGVMGINAYTFLQGLDDSLAEKYLDLAVKAWNRMYESYDKTRDSSPVPHGCRNGLAGTSFPVSGVKNSVTNSLFFLLSLRIYRVYSEKGHQDKYLYLNMAYKQWEWFLNWRSFGYLTTELIQERPLYIAEISDYQFLVHPDWQQTWGWVWSGDQGLIIAALSEILAVKDDLVKFLKSSGHGEDFSPHFFEKMVRKTLSQLGQGIKKGLVGTSDNILREAPCDSNFNLLYAIDYVAGRGVLARFLHAELWPLLGVDFTRYILATAKALISHQDPKTHQFPPSFTSQKEDEAYIKQFRKFWGVADDVTGWKLASIGRTYGVCQAVGLDLLASAIRSSSTSEKKMVTKFWQGEAETCPQDPFEAWSFSCLF